MSDLSILLLVGLLVFGPKRLPEMGRSLGRGMREFKKAVENGPRDVPVMHDGCWRCRKRQLRSR